MSPVDSLLVWAVPLTQPLPVTPEPARAAGPVCSVAGSCGSGAGTQPAPRASSTTAATAAGSSI